MTIAAQPVFGCERTPDSEDLCTTAGDKIELTSTPSEPTLLQTLKAIEQSGALAFWNDPEEDLYTCSDGEPV